MPLYEYACQAKKCGKVFDEIQSLNEPALTKCKICKRGKVIKLISMPGRPVVPGDYRDEVAKIKREAKQTAQKIIKGDERTIADVLGEDAANGRVTKKADINKPKTLDSIKGKSMIKRRKT